MPFALTAFGHVVFGLLTEITVNTPSVPGIVNDILHILFFTFALEFSMEYLKYTLSLITVSRKKWYLLAARALSVISLVVMLLSDIDYLEGNGTKYSAGTGPTLCYMLGFVFFLVSVIILLIRRKQISKSVLFSIVPLSFLGLALMTVQIVVSEFLFTGASLTLMTLGAFFAIENPVGKFQDKAFIDANTGAWNRMAYEYDLKNTVNKRITDGETLTFVMADLDGLKKVNDNYGHLEGDKYISCGARLLNDCMQSAYRIYRIGGDEFVALYFGKDTQTVSKEIKLVESEFGNYSFDLKTPISISIGYAEHNPKVSVEETSKKADAAMYEVKALHHKSAAAK